MDFYDLLIKLALRCLHSKSICLNCYFKLKILSILDNDLRLEQSILIEC